MSMFTTTEAQIVNQNSIPYVSYDLMCRWACNYEGKAHNTTHNSTPLYELPTYTYDSTDNHNRSFRRLTFPYFHWLRSKLQLAEKAVTNHKLSERKFRELLQRFRQIRNWAKEQWGEQAILNYQYLVTFATDDPPANDLLGEVQMTENFLTDARRWARGQDFKTPLTLAAFETVFTYWVNLTQLHYPEICESMGAVDMRHTLYLSMKLLIDYANIWLSARLNTLKILDLSSIAVSSIVSASISTSPASPLLLGFKVPGTISESENKSEPTPRPTPTLTSSLTPPPPFEQLLNRFNNAFRAIALSYSSSHSTREAA